MLLLLLFPFISLSLSLSLKSLTLLKVSLLSQASIYLSINLSRASEVRSFAFFLSLPLLLFSICVSIILLKQSQKKARNSRFNQRKKEVSVVGRIGPCYNYAD